MTSNRLVLIPIALLIVLAVILIPVWNSQAPSVQPSSTMTRAQILQEDLNRSRSLLVMEASLEWQRAVSINSTHAPSWKQWVAVNPSFVYIRLPNGDEAVHAQGSVVRQIRSRASSLRSGSYFMIGNQYYALFRTQVESKPLTGVLHLQQLTQITAHNKTGMRMQTKVPLPKGPHIRTIPNESQESHFHRSQVVVKYKRALSENELEQLQQRLKATLLKKWERIYLFESRKRTTEQLLAYFKGHNEQVEYAEAHYVYSTNQSQSQRRNTFKPNDLLYAPYQWNLPQVSAERAWKFSKGNRKAIIAIVDTGIDLTHPDLKSQLVAGYNTIDEFRAPQDDVGHGTHVAGIIGAKTNNLQGIAGISWYNPLMPVKVLDASGSGYSFSVAQGIIWATDHGAKVINLSLGNYAEGRFLRDAVQYADARDVLLIAASGNENTNQLSYPAAYPEVLCVAATDDHKLRAPYSNYGSYVDVAAPGTHIVSTFPKKSYAVLSGTSMATPHVTALAGLIRAAHPQLTSREVAHIIKATATDLGKKGTDDLFGHGLINIERALVYAENFGTKQHPQEESLRMFLTRLLDIF